MARFFFHLTGDKCRWDAIGEEFTTPEAAAAEGRRLADELSQKRLPCETLRGTLYVTDDEGYGVAAYDLWNARPLLARAHLVN